ncbi:MAG: O-linked N-acetylglucosamine transferase, SPINDLY family protein [Pseudanabaena sp. CAN_BIN31]|nr:O-linked N-acetylglucosamine transferase, SPINDLY family protein [Pseudanabaena sp. CAN_BIN31]
MTTKWEELLLHNDHALVSSFYEKAIELDPNLEINYFYLSLALLLQKKEEESKNVWDLVLERSSFTDLYIKELAEILEQEASRQAGFKEYQTAWNMRQYIRQILPNKFDNLAKICILSLYVENFNLELLIELGFVKITEPNDDDLLSFLVIYVGSYIAREALLLERCLELISFCLPYFQNKDTLIQSLICVASKYPSDISLKIIDAFLNLYPNNRCDTLPFLVALHLRNREYDKAVQIASEIVLEFSQNIFQKTASTYGLLYVLMERGGDWQELEINFRELRLLQSQIIAQYIEFPPNYDISFISVTPFFAPYFDDIPQTNRVIQNQTLHLFCSNLQSSFSDLIQSFQSKHIARRKNSKNRKIRIGYLATSLRRHSVGWLARSLFQHFDRESFEIYGYFPEYTQGADFLEEWYISRMNFVFRQGVEYFSSSSVLLAEQINRDEIDILVDMESLTSTVCLGVLATKPAPIQVSWLGWDASGLPTIDYYIADPYVLPENAQEYYSEKIWRLPHTYIATDGFECSTITLRRCDLGIPDDAIIYFCSQRSYKRHPDIVKAQMQIIRQVPNSYFLIKGLADENYMQKFFYEIAESEGLEKERLIFLPYASFESEHRANMAIVDVVLDTYPYNGATTTMETLWMGIPMVTQVGEQFAARNSYTMMMNVGVTEGIAWNVDEYIEWGVRFGTDESLRRDVAWKLRQSRQTSPLWDGRQFAKEMENAYKQMWEIYNEQS